MAYRSCLLSHSFMFTSQTFCCPLGLCRSRSSLRYPRGVRAHARSRSLLLKSSRTSSSSYRDGGGGRDDGRHRRRVSSESARRCQARVIDFRTSTPTWARRWRGDSHSKRNDVYAASSARDANETTDSAIKHVVPLAFVSFVAGALLGPILDGTHSSHNVLHYTNPSILRFGDVYQLETCWWVPLLFGLAGIILGVSHPLLDDYHDTKNAKEMALPARVTRPSAWFVASAVLVFSFDYWLSGELAQRAVGSEHVVAVDVPLAVLALLTWRVFDNTAGGAFMAALTAVCGPLLEVALINALHLYTYTSADWFGTPSWICWVYAAGAPAVGAVGRYARRYLQLTS